MPRYLRVKGREGRVAGRRPSGARDREPTLRFRGTGSRPTQPVPAGTPADSYGIVAPPQGATHSYRGTIQMANSLSDARRRRASARCPGRPLIGALCIAGLAMAAGGGSSATAAAGTPRPVCPTVDTPAGMPHNARLVLLVPGAVHGGAQSAPVAQLCEVTTGAGARPFYRALPSTDVDIAAGGRLLAYSDPGGLVHVVDVAKGIDRTVGRGVGPRFSPDGAVLAFIGSATAPAPASSESLDVYRLATGRLTELGPATVLRTGQRDPAGLFAWAPRGERIAWLQLGATPPATRLSVATLHGANRAVTTVPVVGIDSGPAWDAAGSSILYWHATTPSHGPATSPSTYRVLRWQLPNGLARTVTPSIPTHWLEGVAPAPVASPQGTAIASLLGASRGGFDQVLLYSPGHGARTIALPGQLTSVRFAPVGARFAATWTQAGGAGPISHAGLVDSATGRVQDLGPARSAFWLAPSASH